jgi:hypothetical protein
VALRRLRSFSPTAMFRTRRTKTGPAIIKTMALYPSHEMNV